MLYVKVVNEVNYYCIASTKSEKFTIDTFNDKMIASSFLDCDDNLIDDLIKEKYFLLLSKDEAWDKMSELICTACDKISYNFHAHNEDLRTELVQEVIEKALSKLKRGKMRFTIGKYPAFNLLTTSIMNLMYSSKTKDLRHMQNKNKLVAEAARLGYKSISEME